MNRIEFNEFASDFKVRFPDDADWIARHKKTWQLWFDEVFVAFRIEEAMDASRGFLIGAYDGWSAYSRHEIPKHYQRVIGKARAERRQAEAQQEMLAFQRMPRGRDAIFTMADRNRPPGQIRMVDAFKQLRKMTAEGATKEEQRAYLDDCFPDPVN